MDDVEVAGDGGLVVDGFGGFSTVVITLAGFFIRFDMLLRRLCIGDGSESVWVRGCSWSVRSLRMTSSFACLSTGRFLKLNEPKSSSLGVDVASRLAIGTGALCANGSVTSEPVCGLSVVMEVT